MVRVLVVIIAPIPPAIVQRDEHGPSQLKQNLSSRLVQDHNNGLSVYALSLSLQRTSLIPFVRPDGDANRY
jgi:hypothetical protein